VPSWRGWLALLLGLTLALFIGVRTIYPFLAVTAPVSGGLLVVEGWAPDYAFAHAAAEFRQHHYDKLYVTGGPMQYGAALAAYHNFAEAGAATLLKLGLDSNLVVAVPAPGVQQDRTYASAVTLSQYLRSHGMVATSVHLVTVGPHARRSRLMFEKAFGQAVAVGVTAVPEEEYDPAHWWRSSAGFRTVTGEALAYLYARFLFRAHD
jgi:uncharacterized SAM-binding protein YcdF (DUF218 family)